ncbi:UvrD-helicase domain-containing protein, partial [Pseudomonas aeruginosa]|uniref:UvrD-helicase domain-containing protein n=1 Tax=Pseudomonas aeruginosa TaxID=287 RepID=UPI0031B7BB7E
GHARHAEEDGRLCIMAVGDDDQNIYAWRDTNNRYIERFREDYEASTSFLVDNYRSSLRIIEAANQLIGQNLARLKEANPIRIDRARQELPAGGLWEERDEQRKG